MSDVEHNEIKDEQIDDEHIDDEHIDDEQIDDVRISTSSEVDSDAEDALFVEDHKKPSNSKTALKITTNHSDMKWQSCDADQSLSPAQKVFVKEQAVQHAITRMLAFLPKLKAVESTLAVATSVYGSQIQTLISRVKDAVITVGFMGVTGAGKSSLINAILELEDLLPADDGPACTAAAIKIAYNDSEDPEKLFRASIDFITRKELQAELDEIRKDIQEDADDTDENEPDDERDERIEKALAWISSVFRIKTKAAFLKRSTDDLLDDPEIKKYIGKEELYDSSDKVQFSEWIRRYIDCSHESAFGLWPLVKVVRIWTKSKVLNEGICLVDLPGSADTNTARGAIAEKFQRELTITCVVAPAVRAESNKTAQDLLGSVQQRTMRLDNQFSSARLCFIISKCDQSIKASRYIDKHSELKKKVASDTRNVGTVKEMQKTLGLYITKTTKEAATLAKEIKRLENEMPGSAGAGQKRKTPHDEDTNHDNATKLQEVKNELSDTQSKLLSAKNKMEDIARYIQQLESRQRKLCISHRANTAISSIKKHYAKVSKTIGDKDIKDLKVFPVSAQAYTERLNGQFVEGYVDGADTGIPGFIQWLIESTLKGRSQNSQAILKGLVDLEESIMSTLADSAMGQKISKKDAKKVMSSFGQKMATLQEQLDSANHEAAKTCAKLATTGLFNKFLAAQRDAASRAEKVVQSNAHKVHWAVFRTTNRKLGVYTAVGKDNTKYDFNAALAGPFFDSLMKAWRKTIYEKLPDSLSFYDDKAQIHVEKFVKDVISISSKSCPSDQVKNWGLSAKRSLELIKKNAQEVFDMNVKEGAKKSHPLMAKSIQSTWTPIYNSCGDESGKGHFERSKNAHLDFITEEEVAEKMYKDGSVAIKKDIRSIFADLPTEFKKGTKAATAKMAAEFHVLLKNNSIQDDEDADTESFEKAKKKLQAVAITTFEGMRQDWMKPVVFMKEEEMEEVKPELEMPNLDEFDL